MHQRSICTMKFSKSGVWDKVSEGSTLIVEILGSASSSWINRLLLCCLYAKSVSQLQWLCKFAYMQFTSTWTQQQPSILHLLNAATVTNYKGPWHITNSVDQVLPQTWNKNLENVIFSLQSSSLPLDLYAVTDTNAFKNGLTYFLIVLRHDLHGTRVQLD